jgi:hypothetical protein
MTDLRLLGCAMRRTVSDILDQFRIWKRAGFALVASSGLLLARAEPLKLYRSPLLGQDGAGGILGVHTLVLRNGVYENAKALDAGLASRARLAESSGPSDCLRCLTRPTRYGTCLASEVAQENWESKAG